jgi:metal-sulfur cluster biosynthetic enzyme
MTPSAGSAPELVRESGSSPSAETRPTPPAGAIASKESGPARADAQTSDGSQPGMVLARLWAALREVEDPEIPVSLVDMGLIVAVGYAPDERAARLKITYTAMGCPAMDMIQDDIRARLLREPDVERVDIEVVWDPVWTHRRLSETARESMRELGLSV